jgi:hypothetical protein
MEFLSNSRTLLASRQRLTLLDRLAHPDRIFGRESNDSNYSHYLAIKQRSLLLSRPKTGDGKIDQHSRQESALRRILGVCPGTPASGAGLDLSGKTQSKMSRWHLCWH